MTERKFDELISYFNRKVSDMDIDRHYKMELLGMVTALGYAHEKECEERKTGRWIPCSERVPDEYREYLVTKRTIGWNCEEYNSIDIAYFDNDGFHKAYKVIAWMPLPEPARMDGETNE